MRTLLTLSFLFLALSLVQAQIKTPAPSPMCKMTQTVGLTDVSLEYSRPSVKGRTIFGELVPYGKMWRTGANASTKVTFSEDVMIQGKTLKAGQYALYTIPGEKTWEVIFYSDLSFWGVPREWDDSQEALRINVDAQELPMTVESMLINIGELRSNQASLELLWENTMVEIPFEVPTDAAVMKSIERTMGGPTAGDYYSAGRYYFESGKDKNKALEYVHKANEMDARFWTLRMESLILADMGKKQKAIEVAKNSLAKAKEAGNDDYVRMNEKSIAEWSK